MFKRKAEADAESQGKAKRQKTEHAEGAAKKSSSKASSAKGSSQSKVSKAEHKDVGKYINKQRTLVFGTRGVSHRDRHFMKDLQDLLPHSKKDVKFDSKDKLHVVNEVCDMKNCNNCVFLEARKHKDLYMWVAKTPTGPSAKFLVQNIHTMAEVKLTGNCLKGARPVLVFDPAFDSVPAYQIMKELFTQVFGSPKGHPKVKPFVDHVFSFFIADNRIWFRNYQIVYEAEGKKSADPVLVEIGPRFVLNPIRIFDGGFSGATLWENPKYVSPNMARALLKSKKAIKYDNRTTAKSHREQYLSETQVPRNEVEEVFEGGVAGDGDNEDNDEANEDNEDQEAAGAGAGAGAGSAGKAAKAKAAPHEGKQRKQAEKGAAAAVAAAAKAAAAAAAESAGEGDSDGGEDAEADGAEGSADEAGAEAEGGSGSGDDDAEDGDD